MKGKSLNIIDLITYELKAVPSTSEARRLIKQNAVKIDGNNVLELDFDCSNISDFYLQIGKKKAFMISLK